MHKKALLAKCQIAAKILKLLLLIVIIIIIFCSDIRPNYFPNCDTDSRLPPRENWAGCAARFPLPPPNTQPLTSPIPNHCYLKRFVRKELYDLEYHFLDGYIARIWCGHNLPANSSSLLGERGKNGWPHVGAKGSQWQRRLWTILYCMAGSGATILDKVN